eukprot:6649055-Pyramimonas_sp.AAC.1
MSQPDHTLSWRHNGMAAGPQAPAAHRAGGPRGGGAQPVSSVPADGARQPAHPPGGTGAVRAHQLCRHN